jgi:hypothetical protein
VSVNIPRQLEAEAFLVEEAKEGHVDPELDRQLEDVQVNWDTGKKQIIELCEKHPGALYQHTIAAGAGAWS